ncbi:uncharacterized protein [Cicer arietinum]|uniref:Uncharacterized protein LOC101514335 n=1 Tax=Cicer arietinum TaxID=3827 RepID=A0A1S2XQI2_CICAR|nr:uncharacterized protein LOC101514335 [Cicer arietinum]
MDMERGPRYNAYAKLRETKLRMNYLRQQQQQQNEQDEPKIPTPPTKQVKFQVGLASGRKGSFHLAQSVPDFTSLLRKENRKPTNLIPPTITTTPPLLKSKSFNKGCGGVLSSSRGSTSVNAGEKKRVAAGGGILMARKSYANIDELRSFSSATANAINGEIRGGGRNSRVVGNKTVLRSRQL